MADNPRLPAINFSLTEDGDKIGVAIIEENGKMSDRHPQSFFEILCNFEEYFASNQMTEKRQA